MEVSTTKKRIAIVGAGIAGLACGYELQKAGCDVVVFEKDAVVGGRMQTTTRKGLLFDSGADFFINRYDLLHAYADELGIPWDFTQQGSYHRVIRGGIAYKIDLTGPMSLLRWKLLSLPARFRFLWWLIRVKLLRGSFNIFHLSEIDASLHDISAGEYLRTQISPEIADFVADPFTGVMHFHRTDDVSAGVLVSLMRMMTESGGFRMCYTKGGMAAIPQALAKLLPLQTGVTVTSVSPKGSSVEVVHDGVSELYDAVVVATTGNVVEEVVKPLPASAHAMLEKLQYAPTITVAFSIPASLFPDGSHHTYVPFVENPIVAGYDNQVRKSASLEHGGRGLLNVYLYEDAVAALKDKKDEEIFSIVRGELEKVCPEVKQYASQVVPHELKYWERAMPKFRHDYVDLVTAFEKQGQGENNIYLAGDYLNSLWTEGAARCGKRVAEQILLKC